MLQVGDIAAGLCLGIIVLYVYRHSRREWDAHGKAVRERSGLGIA